MTVYVDLLFALNTIINYLLLRGSAALGGCRMDWWRLAAAAVLGGGYAVAAVIPGWQFLQHWTAQILFAALMLLTAFGLRRHTVKQALFFFSLSFAFSGAVLLLIQMVEPDCMVLGGRAYYAVSMPAMLLLAGACYLVAAVVLKGCGTHCGGDILPLTVEANGRSICINALRDTGNTLHDPVTGQNVLIVETSYLTHLFPAAKDWDFSDPVQAMTGLSDLYPKCRFCLLSYRAVGVESGLLLAARCRVTYKKRKQSLLAAFSPVQLGDTFHALWGGQPL